MKEISNVEELVEIDCGQEALVFENELIISEIYEKERCARVSVFGIQLDEMWSFVGNSKNKQWIWLALNPYNRQIVAMHVGSRGVKDAKIFYNNIPESFKKDAGFFTDYWAAYRKTIRKEGTHFAVGKDSGLTAYIERFNCTMRQRVSRLVRKGLSFSKSLENHIGAIKYFICDYNQQQKALHL